MKNVDASDLLFDAIAAIGAFAFAAWRLPFAYESAFGSLIGGGALVLVNVILSVAIVLLQRVGLDFFRNWTVMGAIGIGFLVYGLAALIFGKRLADNGKRTPTD